MGNGERFAQGLSPHAFITVFDNMNDIVFDYGLVSAPVQ